MITSDEIVREVYDAEIRIRPYIRKTQIIQSTIGGLRQTNPVFLKLENQQYTGSFKARGSLNKVLSLDEKEKDSGIITASTGNHGMGVARALQLTGTEGAIYLPRTAAKLKVDKLNSLGAHLKYVDGSPLETELHAKQVAMDSGAIWISPYNDPKIVGGQGTIALEVLEQMPDVRRIFITVGGGGLISGIASIIKHERPLIKVIGCVPENSPEMYLSVRAGHIVHLEKAKETLSDGSAGGAEDDSITFPLCSELIDDWVVVTEEEIAEAMRAVYLEEKIVIEGSAGVAVAASLKLADKTDRDLVIICGGNVDRGRFEEVISDL